MGEETEVHRLVRYLLDGEILVLVKLLSRSIRVSCGIEELNNDRVVHERKLAAMSCQQFRKLAHKGIEITPYLLTMFWHGALLSKIVLAESDPSNKNNLKQRSVKRF